MKKTRRHAFRVRIGVYNSCQKGSQREVTIALSKTLANMNDAFVWQIAYRGHGSTKRARDTHQFQACQTGNGKLPQWWLCKSNLQLPRRRSCPRRWWCYRIDVADVNPWGIDMRRSTKICIGSKRVLRFCPGWRRCSGDSKRLTRAKWLWRLRCWWWPGRWPREMMMVLE